MKKGVEDWVEKRSGMLWKWCVAIVGAIAILCACVVGFVWSRYEEPPITGAEILALTPYDSAEEITERWFREWADGHKGWKVPFSYRLKHAELKSMDSLSDGYVEVHYQVEIPGWSRRVVSNLELIGTDEKNLYEGQWVLKWQGGAELWKIEEVMTPVQYQIRSEEFQKEREEPQTTHFAYDPGKQAAYYAKDQTLYVTYDGGEHFIEVPGAYEQVFQTPNGTYDEYLGDNHYLIGEELTAFVGYSGNQVKLIYSLDQGKNWRTSKIYDGYRAKTFLSKTEKFCYATFAVDRTGGSDYYGTFRSRDLENWEFVSSPQEVLSNVSCVWWRDDNTGYYAREDGTFYLTVDGGASYENFDLPQNEDIQKKLGFNPYDTLEEMYQEDGVVYMVIGQGSDGDYAENGKLWRAIFQSTDGMNFVFEKEMLEEIMEAG